MKAQRAEAMGQKSEEEAEEEEEAEGGALLTERFNMVPGHTTFCPDCELSSQKC